MQSDVENYLSTLKRWIIERLHSPECPSIDCCLREKKVVCQFFKLAPVSENNQLTFLSSKHLELCGTDKIGYFGYHVGYPDALCKIQNKKILIECKCLRKPNNACEIRNGILQLQEYCTIYKNDLGVLVVFSWFDFNDEAENIEYIKEGQQLLSSICQGTGSRMEMIWVHLKLKKCCDYK